MNLLNKYEQLVAQGELKLDSGQIKIIEELEILAQRTANFFGLFSYPQGIYLWGDVGRGKTVMMDLFYENLPTVKKIRLHFHRFMQIVHQQLQAWQGSKEPLNKVAKCFAKQAKIICLDEFYVSDITDAMVLGKLLQFMYNKKITLIITSNIAPCDLYKDGLQREQFLPAIKLIENTFKTLYLAGETDYRAQTLISHEIYLYPCTDVSYAKLQQLFNKLSLNFFHSPIQVNNRTIDVIAVADDVVWFDFYAICDGPRSQLDYIEIAKYYHTVFLSNVPQFTANDEDVARRFIALIDELYDHKVKLIIQSETSETDLYQGVKLSFEFKRTASRLREMQSDSYIEFEHKI